MHPARGKRSRMISIHPPREGWDARRRSPSAIEVISIHPPREGWDVSPCPYFGSVKFQSTHPARGGTARRGGITASEVFQSTHPARGGTRGHDHGDAEGEQFQSTHPARGGTSTGTRMYTEPTISIHPPREGWDWAPARPRTPTRWIFQSTHPARGGTKPALAGLCRAFSFQSTHPARGGTLYGRSCDAGAADFNPPTPRGVGHGLGLLAAVKHAISIHPPREGWDGSRPSRRKRSARISIHPPREGWDYSSFQTNTPSK